MLTSHGLHGKLLTAAGSLVGSALQHGQPPSISAPSDEPSAVAAVAWVGVPDVVAAWRHSVSSLGSLQVHSIFTHGAPKVDFTDRAGSSKQCELSDLLLVVDEVGNSNTIVDRRAVLVQAKLFTASGGFSITGKAKDQLELLECWHRFTFVSTSLYGTAVRDFSAHGQPGNSAESGRYGGIGGVTSAPTPYEWQNIVPSSTPAMRRGGGTDFADFLAGMATGQIGFGREAIAGGADDWSKTIDDLLRHSAPQLVKLSASLGPSGRHPRGVTSLTLTTRELQNIVGPTDSDGGPALPGADQIERGDDRGISFVRLVIGP